MKHKSIKLTFNDSVDGGNQLKMKSKGFTEKETVIYLLIFISTCIEQDKIKLRGGSADMNESFFRIVANLIQQYIDSNDWEAPLDDDIELEEAETLEFGD